MTTKPKAAVYIPSVNGTGDRLTGSAPALTAFCAQARDLGFESAWVVDHLLSAPDLYSDSWLEPLSTLAAVSSVSGLRLGTGILVASARPPVLTAKTIASVQALAGSQLILGVGTGWYPKEFEAAGFHRRERGSRTDEFLDVLELMFAGGGSYSGRHYSFEDIVIEDIGVSPEVVIAGGSQLASEGSFEKPVMHPKVADRILRYGGWCVRPTVALSEAQSDKDQLVARGEGRDLDITYINFLHLVETDDDEAALEAQYPHFYRLMSSHRDPEYLKASYFMGSIQSVRQKILDWSTLGLSRIVIHPLVGDIEQVKLWRKHLGDILHFDN